MADSRFEELGREVTHKLRNALERLRHVWDEIGLDTDQRRSRTEVVVLHLNNLLEEMVTEEEALRDRLLKNIEKYGSELLKLAKELDLSPYEPPSGLTNVQLEKDLRKKVGAFEAEKQQRKEKLMRLREQDQHLCDIMCTTPYYIATGAVPSLKQLSELEEHIRGLQAEKERRYNIFQSTKKTILKMLDDLEQCPNTSFERELVCEEDDSFLLTSENMRALKHYCDDLEKQQKENFSLASRLREHMETLWDRLAVSEQERNQFSTKHTGFKPNIIKEIKKEIAQLELMKLQNMKQVIDKTREALTEWYDKCYISQAQRDEFKAFKNSNYTEDVLIMHDQEVARMKKYYDDNQELIELVTRWRTLWTQFLEYDRKAMDANRYFNRGCNLLKEEKARKKVMKDLPKVEEDVRKQIEDWQKASGRTFFVDGVPFVTYIDRQWDEYKHAKEVDKQHRQQAKTKLMEEEMKYGSRPTPSTTPGKKRNMTTTPGRTPNKKFRPEQGAPVNVCNSLSSTASSLASSSTSSLRSLSRQRSKTDLPPPRPPRKMNDTSKTPNAYTPGHNRTGRTNHTSVFSPICMGPRSTAKSKTPGGASTGIYSSRKVLTEKNRGNETEFSQTTVSSGTLPPTVTSIEGNLNDVSLASVGQYQEFARGLNGNARPNCRSSVLPNQLPKPAYF